MREDIVTRYEPNLARVRKLVDAYRAIAGPGPGRRSLDTIDVLRAAVVFLHATLEDVLRTLLARRWPTAGPEHPFDGIPVAPGRRDRVTLTDLASHRGKSVDDVVRESVNAYLERSNFNNVADVKTAMQRAGLDFEAIAPQASSLAAMMTRRHQIVHRADRQEIGGSGNHAAASLGISTVEAWISAVEATCKAIVAQL